MHIHIIQRKTAKYLGFNRYFTGVPCARGHISEKYTGHGSCVECASNHSKSEKKKEYDKIRYSSRREEFVQKQRKYNKIKSKERCEHAKEWARNNPEKRRAISKAYKSRRRQIEKGGDSTARILEWESSAIKKCYWCGLPCKAKYHIDHYNPLSKGGKHEVSNLVISCPRCNLRKNAKDPYDFAAEVGRLF